MFTKVLLNKYNLIRYLRLILLFSLIFFNDYLFVALYLSSILLNYFNNIVEKVYNETTIIGSSLDMIVNRILTIILSVKIITKKYFLNERNLVYIFFDILSNFLYFIGKTHNKVSHKKEFSNVFLNLYYHYIIVNILYLGTEISCLMLYILNYSKYSNYLFIIPGIKTLFNIAHLYVGLVTLSNTLIY